MHVFFDLDNCVKLVLLPLSVASVAELRTAQVAPYDDPAVLAALAARCAERTGVAADLVLEALRTLQAHGRRLLGENYKKS